MQKVYFAIFYAKKTAYGAQKQPKQQSETRVWLGRMLKGESKQIQTYILIINYASTGTTTPDDHRLL